MNGPAATPLPNALDHADAGLPASRLSLEGVIALDAEGYPDPFAEAARMIRAREVRDTKRMKRGLLPARKRVNGTGETAANLLWRVVRGTASEADIERLSF